MGKRKSSGTPARSRKRARQQPAVATDSARHNTSTVATEPIPEGKSGVAFIDVSHSAAQHTLYTDWCLL